MYGAKSWITVSTYLYKSNYVIDSSPSNVFYQRQHNHSHRTVVTTVAFYDKPDPKIVSNHRRYTKTHNYDYFILRQKLYQYTTNGIRFGTQQRALLVWNLLFNKSFETNIERGTTYSRVLWVDFDAVFINDNITIDEIVFYTYKMNCIEPKYYHNVSVIVTGDHYRILNAGVMIFNKNKFTQDLLMQWHKLMNLCKYYPNYLKLIKFKSETKQANNDNDYDYNYNYNYDYNSRTHVNVNYKTTCYINDQKALAILLFYQRLNISDSILLQLGNYNLGISNDFDKNDNETMMEMFDGLDKVSGIFHKKSIANSSYNYNYNYKYGESMFYKHVYTKMVVIPSQCLQVRHEMLSRLYFNHVVWINQEKMNANIWSQYKNTKILNQWIVHFAGQKNKYNLLQMFLKYKHFMHDRKNNHSEIEKENKTHILQQQIVSYVHNQRNKKDMEWIKRMEKSKVSYKQWMTHIEGHRNPHRNSRTHNYSKYTECESMHFEKQRLHKNRDRNKEMRSHHAKKIGEVANNINVRS